MRLEAEDILTDLVLMRSTSEDSVQPIVDYVCQKLVRLGMEPRRYGSNERPAIVSQFRQNGVMLSGHLDTVPHGTGWKRDQADIVDGVMYGRGACDMKGGCTAMLLAAQELVAANVPFSLCFTTDEETTMNGAAAAAKDKAFSTAPAVLITEPSNFEIVVKEKGLLHFSISTHGKAAHASLPHLGENAIAKMVGLLSRLDDLQIVPKDPVSEMTLCVDTIKGGTRINVIPGDCEVEIDVRYPPNMNTQSVLDLVRSRIGTQGYDVKILHELDPVETNPDNPAVKTLRGLIGPGARIASVPYATEMVQFKSSNPAVMVCGPGEPSMCHIIDERIEVSQIVKAAELYVEFCSRMADG